MEKFKDSEVIVIITSDGFILRGFWGTKRNFLLDYYLEHKVYRGSKHYRGGRVSFMTFKEYKDRNGIKAKTYYTHTELLNLLS